MQIGNSNLIRLAIEGRSGELRQQMEKQTPIYGTLGAIMAMRQVEIDHKVSELQKAANKPQVPPPREIIDIGSEFGALLTEAIAGQAHRVFEDLSPRQFEEFIAEIWSRFGFSVELTKSTRDGGYDVVAVSDAPASVLSQKFAHYCESRRAGYAWPARCSPNF